MDFLEHSFNWIKDELFEGKLVLAYGIILIIINLLFWSSPLVGPIGIFLIITLVSSFSVSLFVGDRSETNHKIIEEYIK